MVDEQNGLAGIADRAAVEIGAFKVGGSRAEIPVKPVGAESTDLILAHTKRTFLRAWANL